MKKITLFVMISIFLALPVWSQINFLEEMALSSQEFKSLAYDDVNVWANDPEQQTLSAFEPVSGEKIYSVKLSKKGEYLAFDGMRLVITDNETKQLMAVNRATGELQPYMDLKNIQGQRDLYLEPLRTGDIMGITFGDEKLWVACGSGYSSSIYEIDPVNQVVLSHRFAPGPTPVSLLYHEGNLWVLDKDSEAIRCLKDCKQLVYDLRVETGNQPVSLLNFKDKLFVAGKTRGPLKGVSKNDLHALVPEKVDTSVATPFKDKPRKATDSRGRKVAVLISGDTAASGYNEFWVDVVIMYRIMQQRGYNEIYVLYADGKDYTCGWSKYEEKMTDFACRKTDVIKIFEALSNGDTQLGINALSAADILFVYTFDHGASDGKLCLWNGERYSPTEMAATMKNIHCAKKIFYMQQCFSGAFKEEFSTTQLSNMAILTAASNKEYAYRADTEKETYNGKYYYHGEFNWHFMSALAGKTPTGEAVNADTNGDGKVSVLETFSYYQKMNSLPKQTPQYKSIPESIGSETTP